MNPRSKMGKHRALFVQYVNPAQYPPLINASRILVKAGFQVRFVGLPGAGQASSLVLPDRPEIEFAPLRSSHNGCLRYLHFLVSVLVHGLVWRPSVIYCSDSMSTPVLVMACLFKCRKKIYHEHDFDMRLVRRKGLFCRLLRLVYKLAVRRADLCVFPNRGRQALSVSVAKSTGNHSFCVMNCPSIEEMEPLSRTESPDCFVVLYQGNIGPGGLPLTVLTALTKTHPSVILHIRGYETVDTQGYLRKIMNLALQLGIESRVLTLPPVPRDRLLGVLAGYHLGLALLAENPNDRNYESMSGASNKVFDYLACGLPVLVPAFSQWDIFTKDPAVAITCDPDDPGSVAGALTWCASNRRILKNMGIEGRDMVERTWNYEHQFAPALKEIQN